MFGSGKLLSFSFLVQVLVTFSLCLRYEVKDQRTRGGIRGAEFLYSVVILSGPILIYYSSKV